MLGILLAPYSASPKRLDFSQNVFTKTRMSASLPVNDRFMPLKFSGEKDATIPRVASGTSEDNSAETLLSKGNGGEKKSAMSIEGRMAELKLKIMAQQQQKKAKQAQTPNPFTHAPDEKNQNVAQQPTQPQEQANQSDSGLLPDSFDMDLDALIQEAQDKLAAEKPSKTPSHSTTLASKETHDASSSNRNVKQAQREDGEVSDTDSKSGNRHKELFPDWTRSRAMSAREMNDGRRRLKRPRRHETLPSSRWDDLDVGIDPFANSLLRSGKRTRTLPTHRELEQMAPPIPNHDETDPNYWWNLGGEGLTGVTPQPLSTSSRRPTVDLPVAKRFINHDLSGN
jgi:hypothetical protein